MAQKDTTVDDITVSEQIQKLAEACEREGRYGDAAGFYKKLVERHPGDDSFVLKLAWACHDSGQIEDAIDCFENLFKKELSRKVFTGFAFDELVRIYKRQGRFDRLLQVCEKATAAHPDDYSLMGDLGDACMKMGQADRAAAVYREMIRMEPDSSIIFCNLGGALMALEDFAGVEEAYENACAIEPDKTASFYCRLADQYHKTGHGERAERAIRRSLQHCSSEPAYYFMLGDILIEEGKVDEGWAAYESGIHMRQAYAGANYDRLGSILTKALQHERAADAFQQATVAEPTNPLYLLHLARAYLALGQEEMALATVKKAEALT
ncbi:MAG: tetratricopeptide repeat protein [Syntrophales bacterium]|nr:tetratricopeptide repeat protein [Syntrophales bacterium]